MENKDNTELNQGTQEEQKKQCQGQCKSSEEKCNDWNWSKVKDMLMCWNESGKDSGQDSYNIVTMVCMVVIAACVLFISFSVMGISQNMEKMANIDKYISELN